MKKILFISIFFLILGGCKKTEVAKVSPTVGSVTSASVVTTTTATIKSTVTEEGTDAVISRGVVYGLNPNPTISDSKTTDGAGLGDFTSLIAGLTPGKTYYFRTYATNSAGTSYGNEITVTTLTQDIKNIVPDNILTVITNLGMPIYTGKTPPNLVNFYKLSPRSLKKSNVPNDYAAGTNFFDMNIHFYSQDNNLLSLKMDFAEMGSGGGTGSGKGAFISGSGNNFSVFLQVNYTASGQTCDMIEVFSGTMTSTGIKDLYDALFMVDDHGDPGNLWIANGQGRIFYDSDGLSPIIASLSSKMFGNCLGIISATPSVRIN